MPAIFRRKRFPRLKGFKGDEKAWSDWRYMFRVEASRCFRQAGAILDWTEDGYDQPVSESDIQQVAARESWADMANFNVQLHGDLVSLMEECTEGFEVVRNTKTEVGLDGWGRLNRKYDPTVVGEVARAVASWLFRRGCKHGETRARAARGSPEIWR